MAAPEGLQCWFRLCNGFRLERLQLPAVVRAVAALAGVPPAEGSAFFFPLHHLVAPVPPGALAVLSAEQMQQVPRTVALG